MWAPAGPLLHRLVWGPPLARGAWRTKADRAAVWDARVAPRDVLGTIIAVERAGSEAPRALAGGLGTACTRSSAGSCSLRRSYGNEIDATIALNDALRGPIAWLPARRRRIHPGAIVGTGPSWTDLQPEPRGRLIWSFSTASAAAAKSRILVERFDVDRATAEADYGAFLAKLISIKAVNPPGR